MGEVCSLCVKYICRLILTDQRCHSKCALPTSKLIAYEVTNSVPHIYTCSGLARGAGGRGGGGGGGQMHPKRGAPKRRQSAKIPTSAISDLLGEEGWGGCAI